MVLTSAYLWKFSNASRTSLSQLMWMMVEDGIMYFIALCAMNIVNIIFFQSPNTTLQPSASTLVMAVMMIFSARFIPHASRDGIPASGHTPAHLPSRLGLLPEKSATMRLTSYSSRPNINSSHCFFL
ncbi:hypothetical protein B0H13DRAFT_2383619 [Mycena leptocephala]|nr:hypothetical protein B0H13DRAFT_2383619 [Mycena leptocephala]